MKHKVPQFTLGHTEKDGIMRICINGIYIGRIYNFRNEGGVEFVPKGYTTSFARHHIYLHTFESHDKALEFLKIAFHKRFEKHGKFI